MPDIKTSEALRSALRGLKEDSAATETPYKPINTITTPHKPRPASLYTMQHGEHNAKIRNLKRFQYEAWFDPTQTHMNTIDPIRLLRTVLCGHKPFPYSFTAAELPGTIPPTVCEQCEFNPDTVKYYTGESAHVWMGPVQYHKNPGYYIAWGIVAKQDANKKTVDDVEFIVVDHNVLMLQAQFKYTDDKPLLSSEGGIVTYAHLRKDMPDTYRYEDTKIDRTIDLNAILATTKHTDVRLAEVKADFHAHFETDRIPSFFNMTSNGPKRKFTPYHRQCSLHVRRLDALWPVAHKRVQGLLPEIRKNYAFMRGLIEVLNFTANVLFVDLVLQKVFPNTQYKNWKGDRPNAKDNLAYYIFQIFPKATWVKPEPVNGYLKTTQEFDDAIDGARHRFEICKASIGKVFHTHFGNNMHIFGAGLWRTVGPDRMIEIAAEQQYVIERMLVAHGKADAQKTAQTIVNNAVKALYDGMNLKSFEHDMESNFDRNTYYDGRHGVDVTFEHVHGFTTAVVEAPAGGANGLFTQCNSIKVELDTLVGRVWNDATRQSTTTLDLPPHTLSLMTKLRNPSSRKSDEATEDAGRHTFVNLYWNQRWVLYSTVAEASMPADMYRLTVDHTRKIEQSTHLQHIEAQLTKVLTTQSIQMKHNTVSMQAG